MGAVLGLSGKLYRNTGTYNSPTWLEIENVKDLNLSLTKGKADVTSRASNGWRQNKATLKEAVVEFQMVWNTDDADFTAIQEAWMLDTPIEFLVLDGPYDTPGSQGLRATMDVFEFSRDESLEEAMMASVTIEPTYEPDHPPEWFEAA